MIIENRQINNYVYIVLSKIEGEKLSDIFKENKNVNKNKYLYNYGRELAKIHKYKINWPKAKMRNINYVPKKKAYKAFDEWKLKIILKKLNLKVLNIILLFMEIFIMVIFCGIVTI